MGAESRLQSYIQDSKDVGLMLNASVVLGSTVILTALRNSIFSQRRSVVV